MTAKANKKRLKKMLAYNPAAIIQFNIDTIESCTQLLANVDVPIPGNWRVKYAVCWHVHRCGLR